MKVRTVVRQVVRAVTRSITSRFKDPGGLDSAFLLENGDGLQLEDGTYVLLEA